MEKQKNQYTLQSVSNALDIIDLLGLNEELSLAEIARNMNVSKATAFRLVSTLEQHNFLTKNHHAKYRLSIKFATLGDIVTHRMEIIRIVHPYLEKLSEQFGETAHLVVWNSKMDVIVADRVIGNSPISYKTVTGFVTPAHMAASGRILLAYTDAQHLEDYTRNADYSIGCDGLKNEIELRNMISKIRHTGVAENNGDAIPGLTCFAVPIFNKAGKAIASLSISGAEANMEKKRHSILQALRASAEKIDDYIAML